MTGPRPAPSCTRSCTLSADPRWERIEALFDAALDLPPRERAPLLDRECAGDIRLRAEVERLIEAHGRTTGILDHGLPPLVYDVADHLQRSLSGRYRIDGEIGHGGMSIVFRAHEVKHGRTVVIKALKPEAAAALGTDRFLREVQIAARLAHPHILGLLDSGNADGVLFYVMPMVQGETLREHLRGGELPLPQALTLLRDVADALAYAHRAGVVHRDLKPENVLIVGEHAYLMDFGIAKLVRDSGEFQYVTEGVGLSIGTPAYMAPEQAAGDPDTDQRADLYAWGLLAQEMLTGRPPRGFSMQRADPLWNTPIEAVRRDVPADLVRLIDSCLDPDPGQRIASAASVLEQLEALSAPASRATAPPRTRRTRAPVLAALAGVIVLGAWMAWPSGSRDRVPQPVAVASLVNETGDTSLAVWGRLAGDWITQGLQETGRVAVIPWPAASIASDRVAEDRAAGRSSNAVELLRAETRAGTVVTGSYYLIGDSVRFQVEVTNAVTGRLLGALPPLVVERAAIGEGVALLRQRLMGQMAVWSDDRIAVPGVGRRPPTFAAYRLFDLGLDLYNGTEYARAAERFRRAHEADTSFTVAMIYEALCQWNIANYPRVDSLLAHLTEHNDLSPYDELSLRGIRAMAQSRGEEALRAFRRAAELAPGSRAVYIYAWVAVHMGRPAEAVAALEGVDPDRGAFRGWNNYWLALAYGRHQLGRYEAELDAARQMLARNPDSRLTYVLQARALAAMGRTAPIDSLLAATASLTSRTSWSHGAILVSAGEELAAHGYPEAARDMLQRGVAWLVEQTAAAPDYPPHAWWLGSAYYALGRWTEAADWAGRAARLEPDRRRNRDFAVITAVRAGRTRAARARLDPPDPQGMGAWTLARSRLAAIAGDHETALSLLSEALGQRVEGWPWVHATAFPDYAQLAADPRYRQVMAPAGSDR